MAQRTQQLSKHEDTILSAKSDMVVQRPRLATELSHEARHFPQATVSRHFCSDMLIEKLLPLTSSFRLGLENSTIL